MNNISHSQLAPLPSQVPFRIVSATIGSGAYACIKKAAPLTEETPIFAVKFINKHYAHKYGRLKQKQLEMEIALHKHIGLHKNVIEFYDHGDDDAWKWIAMELAEGGDLFDKIEADAGIAEDIAHVYFTQLVSAVSFMHSRGVAHRDIKPENVLVSADGDLKLADFGMATLFEYHGRKKLATSLCGSPPYVAPEVLSCSTHAGNKGRGYAADMADVWSCGVVLFVLLAGNTPWSRPVEEMDEYGRPNEYSEYVQTNGKPNDELWDSLPAQVPSLLRGMMRVSAESRYTMEDVRRHPWFTRPNRYMDQKGRLIDPITMATNMFESLRVNFEADPLAHSQKASVIDHQMDLDAAAGDKFSSTQPNVPAEDMLFDWDLPRNHMISSTQVGADMLQDEPAMSQYSQRPKVSMTLTQRARQFRDILPAQSLTKFYSSWTMSLLVPHLLEALSRLGVPTARIPRPERQELEYSIRIRSQDTRGCPLSGNIVVEVISDGLVQVCFVKGSGDPLEWRRFFKNVTVFCQDAVLRLND
ncbi:hypothetical protein PV10_03643 [Exophiala mesophila]|uniref:non-specific serine/threonine protein kinase n=1 Tax=Exophiala mesophila TaxID=212818 RepID=A0A0D1ZN94_EXOME|nr:uncharacterized protein PV10_03643 [Exophiala mesophila]KIV96062.1 hypothetical protein PV10_03643 [Exophiala mesophila]